ncbi:MAG: hypothetical protein JWO31_1594 [Phycisphaerales bacterium]|nr:hypothetical protein [Phycisphaerales bacterium]
MDPFDICWAKFFWRREVKARPWLLIRIDHEDPRHWLCLAISTKDYDSNPFEVAKDDPDFEATGLADTSYIYDGDPFVRIPRESLNPPCGWLSKGLLERFKKSAGF